MHNFKLTILAVLLLSIFKSVLVFQNTESLDYRIRDFSLEIKPLIDKNDIIIDIGCNIGELTYYLSRFDPTIYAFDIEQKALDCLKLNCSDNKKIIVQKLAIFTCYLCLVVSYIL